MIGELIEKFLQYDGLTHAHSFEKAVTIRDTNNEVVEDGETTNFEAVSGTVPAEDGGENDDSQEDGGPAGSGGLSRWPWRDTNEYRLPGAYRRLMIRPGQWTHRQIEYDGYTKLLRPLKEVDKCALLQQNERKDQYARVVPEDAFCSCAYLLEGKC